MWGGVKRVLAMHSGHWLVNLVRARPLPARTDRRPHVNAHLISLHTLIQASSREPVHPPTSLLGRHPAHTHNHHTKPTRAALESTRRPAVQAQYHPRSSHPTPTRSNMSLQCSRSHRRPPRSSRSIPRRLQPRSTRTRLGIIALPRRSRSRSRITIEEVTRSNSSRLPMPEVRPPRRLRPLHPRMASQRNRLALTGT